METVSENSSLLFAGSKNDTIIYKLTSKEGLACDYFIASNPTTRHLMMAPEVIGFDSYLSMVPPTADMLSFLYGSSMAECFRKGVSILTILRGGLNYPLEECCHKAGIQVGNIHFLSCERIIRDHVITGLDIKYQKLHVCKDCTLMIGDIIASGDTLSLCLDYVISQFQERGGSLRRLIFFTVGGTKAISKLEDLNKKIKDIWPEFEGITCIFYEGIFTVYTDKGVTGINVPDIDFGWKEGYISPEFRRAVLKDDDALFEKCIIYDGGARRYEIQEHVKEVKEYWEDILRVSSGTDFKLFLDEKLGYEAPVSFEGWLKATGYGELDGEDMKALFDLEKTYIETAGRRNLEDIAKRRLSEFSEATVSYTE